MSLTIHPAFIATAIAESVIKHKQDILDGLMLVSVPQAAKLLDVGEDKVRSLVRGEFVDVGGKGMKIKLSTIQRIVEERTITLRKP